jgi:DnaK suppressor protein
MNDTERRHIEQRLMQERERAQESLDRYQELTRTSTEDDGDLTQYKQHLADEGTDTMEQEKAMLLLQNESEMASQIDEALQRLYKDPEKFGVCEACGRDIKLERLDLVPWARTCAECQRAEEAGAGDGAAAAG